MADSLANLKPDPRNARRHTSRNVGMIESALREIGAARSIVIDETNTVLAGNATIEAAAAAGIERVQIVDADGETIIAAEQLGRTCYGMEIDPKYCDVIVRRWEEFTGQTAQRAVTAEAAD